MQNLGGQTKSIMVFSEVAYTSVLGIYHLGPFQTSNFTCAESNANERKQ